uniref:Reactive oxygen species modulator 1 n=1 Tax=Pongo abelii TaxID=9601 RepID=H2P1S6_PONAB
MCHLRERIRGSGQQGGQEGSGIFRCVAARRGQVRASRTAGPERTAQAQPPSGRRGLRPWSRCHRHCRPPPSGSEQHGPAGRAHLPKPLQSWAPGSRKCCPALRKRFFGPRAPSPSFSVRDVELSDRGRERGEMPVAVGPYGQSQPSCFDRVKMGFVMGCAVGMAAGALFGTFSCLRIGMRGRELMGGIGKTMMQSGGTFGTFMAIGMGIRC